MHKSKLKRSIVTDLKTVIKSSSVSRKVIRDLLSKRSLSRKENKASGTDRAAGEIIDLAGATSDNE